MTEIEELSRKLAERGEAVDEMKRKNAETEERHRSCLFFLPPNHAVVSCPSRLRKTLASLCHVIPPTTGDLISVITCYAVLREG